MVWSKGIHSPITTAPELALSATVSRRVSFQSRIRLSTISSETATASVAAPHVLDGHVRTPQRGAQKKRHLRLHPRRAESFGRNGCAGGKHHIVEDVAEVGLVDAK